MTRSGMDKYDPPILDLAEELDEEEAFKAAMADVTPLRAGRQRAIRSARPVSESVGLPDTESPLEEFMNSSDLDWSFTPDYIEGGADSWNNFLLRRLRSGRFSVQEELDLHGLSRNEARRELLEFVRDCVRRGVSCVRVVHGSGRHSNSGVPVLKESVKRWFRTRVFARHVVAYTSARPVDGGLGAIYVLLSPGRRGKAGG